jgi:signal transduction histidine kinase/CheY-like chemotaxis protein
VEDAARLAGADPEAARVRLGEARAAVRAENRALSITLGERLDVLSGFALAAAALAIGCLALAWQGARISAALARERRRQALADAGERRALLFDNVAPLGGHVLLLGPDGSIEEESAGVAAMTAPWGSTASWWAALSRAIAGFATQSCPECGATVRADRQDVELTDPAGQVHMYGVRLTGHGHRLSLGPAPEVLIFADITTRRRLDASLRLTDRMSSLGQLAAGLAHEVNNPLTWMLGNLDLAERDLASNPPRPLAEVVERVTRAREGAERVRDVVGGLRAFARGGEPGITHVDLGSVVAAAVNLTRRTVSDRAKLVVEVSPAIPPARGNDAWLGQVLVNLLVNAAQALPTGAPQAHEVRVEVRADGPDWLRLEVSDTGPGIPPASRRSLFQPFFTTKPADEGTGLGLYICAELMSRMGGSIECLSPERGAAFALRVPAFTAPPQARPRPAPRGAAPGARILLLDDEVALTEVMVPFFEGDQVVVAHDGLAGLALALDGHWDAILCDVTLREMSGMALHARLVAQRPELADRMIFMSGGTANAEVISFLSKVSNECLLKPFRMAEARAAVQALTARGADGPTGRD